MFGASCFVAFASEIVNRAALYRILTSVLAFLMCSGLTPYHVGFFGITSEIVGFGSSAYICDLLGILHELIWACFSKAHSLKRLSHFNLHLRMVDTQAVDHKVCVFCFATKSLLSNQHCFHRDTTSFHLILSTKKGTSVTGCLIYDSCRTFLLHY